MSSIKNKGLWLVVLLVLLIAGAYFAYNFTMQAPPQISEQAATISLSADKFIDKAVTNIDTWQNEIIQLEGTITSTSADGATMNKAIFLQFTNDMALKTMQTPSQAVVKGRFIGYDELLEEFKFDNCVIIK